MNATQLIELFERISEVPDGISRLRQFILDLAVRGKLVKQDPSDEPASALLKQMQSEKTLRTEGGDGHKAGPLFAVENESPFLIPSSWAWTRLGHIGEWGSGSTPSRGIHEFFGGGVTWLKSGELNDNLQLKGSEETITELAMSQGSFRRNKPGDVLIAMYGATIGKLAILAEPAVTNQAVCGCTPLSGVLNRYLFVFLLSQRAQFHSASEGGAQPNISKVKIVRFPFPLPPFLEQQRIVAKVDELMSLCDRLEDAQKEREDRRNKLVALSLHHLNNGKNDDSFHDSARFYLSNLPRLTTCLEHIQQLRETILNLAVHGKLIEQDRADEPASELLARIHGERSVSKKDTTRKKKNVESSIHNAPEPFPLPTGWTWAHFPDLGIFGRGKSKHRPRNDPSLYEGGTHYLIQTGDVAGSNGLIKTYTNKYNDIGLAQSAKWPRGTLCITIAANIADSGILAFDACFPDSVVGFVPWRVFPNAKYFEYFIRTAKADLLKFAPATAQKNINLEILNSIMIPLPPIAEQNRIVARVDELLALCHRLEAELTTTETEGRRLLEVVLYEALNGAK